MPTSGLYQKLFENSEYRYKALDYCAVVIITHCFYSELLFLTKQLTRRLLVVSFCISRKSQSLMISASGKTHSFIQLLEIVSIPFFVRRSVSIWTQRRRANLKRSAWKPRCLALLRVFPTLISFLSFATRYRWAKMVTCFQAHIGQRWPQSILFNCVGTEFEHILTNLKTRCTPLE